MVFNLGGQSACCDWNLWSYWPFHCYLFSDRIQSRAGCSLQRKMVFIVWTLNSDCKHTMINKTGLRADPGFWNGGWIFVICQRNQILFQYLRDKKKKERRGLRKRGVKIHPFHLPWIRACRTTAKLETNRNYIMVIGLSGVQFCL